MLNLKANNKQLDIKYNYRLYKNIVGDDEDKQLDNFDSFLGGLITDQVDAILKFGVAASNKKLSMEEVADQLDGQDAFDDVHSLTDEILNGLCNAGFLTSKVREWKKRVNTMIEQMQKVLDEESKDDSQKLTKKEKEDRQESLKELQETINQAKEQMKKSEARLNLK
ncbi:hypothetical protein [Companilactobacillus nantensis]|uniref:Uncharacterized protein n=1 Tax=Companilactobacillus nantensis DSM 16982 TaxID=1423774 RepID=A0A0R1WI36_9LACO|nr:hypothetical protein [Companilactobacillus nantensis]KRM17261.1 hypothetical protein FD31_GL000340 [Companilactobacillus nantensis DSM 16982]GEO64012.1 hypothetical protein LNA01_11950 [Companilactobacillus nantensis]